MTGEHFSQGTRASDRTWTRRKVLAWGLGGMGSLLAVGTAGIELVLHDVLPGHQALNQLDGTCSVASSPRVFSALGAAQTGQFFSFTRNRTVGYTIAYPTGHGPGSALPLVIALHGFGNDHTSALSGLSCQQALALHVDGKPLAAMAIVAADGGDGYWHPHPGDDPMGMVINEIIPMCHAIGLGRPPQRIGVMGISMGGYGALLMAEKYPGLIAAVAAISPAIWTQYSQARSANPRAYASAGDFGANNVIAHAPALASTSVRVASGSSDPFRAGVEALARALPPGAVVDISKGCHTGPFFSAQQPASLQFLAAHLAQSPAR